MIAMIEELRNDWKIKHFKNTRIMIAWEINYWNTQRLDITGAREDNWKFGEKKRRKEFLDFSIMEHGRILAEE